MPISDSDPDYPALTMANSLLGGGGNSRLWKRIRETEGLSYDVNTRVSWNSHEANSIWMASAIFAPQNAAKVEKAFREELERALARWRRGLIGWLQARAERARAARQLHADEARA